MRVYLLAAVRREHRRLTHVAQNLDRSSTPDAVVSLIEEAMLSLDDAAAILEQLTTPTARTGS